MPDMPEIQTTSSIPRALIAGLASAIFLVMSFAPFSFWGCAFLIPFPLFILARSSNLSPSRAAFWGAMGTLPGWIWTHFWISEVSVAGLIPLVIQLGIFTFLFVWIARHLTRRVSYHAFVLPVVWVGVEFLRGSIVWTGYPWYLIAHPLIDSPMGILAMPASLGGVYFVSYLCATYSIVLLLAICSKTSQERYRYGIIAGVVFSCWIGIGYLLIPSSPENPQSIRVGVIQPDVPQDNRLDWTVRQRVRDWLTLRDLTIAAATDPKNPEKLDAIIWPEGFVPGWTLDPKSFQIEHDAELAWILTLRDPEDVPELTGMPTKIQATMVVDEMLILQQAMNIPMVVGSVAFDNLRIVDTDQGYVYERDAMYNSAFVILDGQPQPVWYDKLHLMPFGEVMPYISSFDWLESMLLSFGAQGMEFSLSKGKELKRLSIPLDRDGQIEQISLATPICFEATISSICRKLVFDAGKRQSGVMINMTNDGWFGSWDAGRTSHMLHARWRCVELRTPMVRSANTGFSAIIDHGGGILTQDIVAPDPSQSRQGYLIADVTLGVGTTVFAHIGNLFGWICFMIVLAWTLPSIFRRSKVVQNADHDPKCV